MKIKGLRSALKEYREVNKGGCFDPFYGYLMMDLADGSVWTDTFYDIGHNSFKVYHNNTVINLGAEMNRSGLLINERNVKRFVAAIEN